jgi:hypothetical protein
MGTTSAVTIRRHLKAHLKKLVQELQVRTHEHLDGVAGATWLHISRCNEEREAGVTAPGAVLLQQHLPDCAGRSASMTATQLDVKQGGCCRCRKFTTVSLAPSSFIQAWGVPLGPSESVYLDATALKKRVVVRVYPIGMQKHRRQPTSALSNPVYGTVYVCKGNVVCGYPRALGAV